MRQNAVDTVDALRVKLLVAREHEILDAVTSKATKCARHSAVEINIHVMNILSLV